MTRAAREFDVVYHDLAVRRLEVVRVTRLSPRMTRVTLGGSELAGFVDRSPADHLKVFFPEPGAAEPVLPVMDADGDGIQMPEGPPYPVHRDYTTRRYDAAAGELDLDFVLHGHGAASAWAAQAAPGQVLGVVGPRGSIIVLFDFDWYLFAGDETALPGIARFLEALPAGANASVYLLVDGPQEEQSLPSRADVRVTWLHRARPGPSDLLDKAIREFVFPDGEGYVWIAGEAGELRPIRRYLHRERGMDRETTDVDGFWKRGVVNLDHHEPDEDDD
ncbi:siderophore-interacting protein [Actinomadura syzygii]|uniref:Siderophore-interacting protein n=1 Tax=Actinomadura syzygii TaxID=1427538 RepID=A0A5D0TQQ7_9ACTN|nr:siderophore-interacting protein [Actinomadura syzygii]TYC07622.1 siderophore-interacting protein [Actinomadura syzygii]